eukprot:485319-Prorocentrum_minimum.AAC.2
MGGRLCRGQRAVVIRSGGWLLTKKTRGRWWCTGGGVDAVSDGERGPPVCGVGDTVQVAVHPAGGPRGGDQQEASAGGCAHRRKHLWRPRLHGRCGSLALPRHAARRKVRRLTSYMLGNFGHPSHLTC